MAVSWFGRCNILKMNFTPRLLYLLQALPVKIPQSFFSKLRTIFINYVWQGKPSRLRRSLLQWPKPRGGVGLPDPVLCYTVVHMNRVVDWCRHLPHKLWVRLEQETVLIPLAGLPWSGTQFSWFSSPHPLIKPTLQELHRYFRIAETASFPSPLTPIIGHPDFAPGISDRSFWLQSDQNLVRASSFLGPSEWVDPLKLISYP